MLIRSETFQKWWVVGLLWAVATLNYVDRTTIFAVFPLLRRQMGLSDVTLALLGSTFLWAYGFSSPVAGYLGDRLRRKRVVLTSLLLFSLVTFATGLVHSASQLIVLRVLLGLSEALFLPAALAHIAAFHPAETRSIANALALTGFSVGAGFGGVYGGFMAEHYSWRLGFYLLGLLGGLLCLALWFFLPATSPRKDTVVPLNKDNLSPESLPRKLLACLATPTAACVIFLAFALSLSSWSVGTWMPTYLHDKFGLSLTNSGLGMAGFTYAPALAGSVVGGLWADRWARRSRGGRVRVQLIALSIMAPAMLAVGFMHSLTPLASDLLLYSAARGLLEVNSMPILSTVIPPHRWSSAYGLYNLSGTLAGSLGVLFIGYMNRSWGIGNSLSAMSVLLFMAVGVMMLVDRRFLKKDMQSEENRHRISLLETAESNAL